MKEGGVKKASLTSKIQKETSSPYPPNALSIKVNTEPSIRVSLKKT